MWKKLPPMHFAAMTYSLAEKALMTDAWWILLIPGAFLVVTLLCITNLGDYLRSRTSRKESNL